MKVRVSTFVDFHSVLISFSKYFDRLPGNLSLLVPQTKKQGHSAKSLTKLNSLFNAKQQHPANSFSWPIKCVQVDIPYRKPCSIFYVILLFTRSCWDKGQKNIADVFTLHSSKILSHNKPLCSVLVSHEFIIQTELHGSYFTISPLPIATRLRHPWNFWHSAIFWLKNCLKTIDHGNLHVLESKMQELTQYRHYTWNCSSTLF